MLQGWRVGGLVAWFCLSAATPGFAEPWVAPPHYWEAADTCAANLPPLALRIYNAVKPDLRPGDDLRGVIKGHVMPWVMMGEVSRGQAKASAMAAAQCFRLRPGP